MVRHSALMNYEAVHAADASLWPMRKPDNPHFPLKKKRDKGINRFPIPPVIAKIKWGQSKQTQRSNYYILIFHSYKRKHQSVHEPDKPQVSVSHFP